METGVNHMKRAGVNHMKRVTLESPFAGKVERNITYARRAMLDSLDRNEAPFLSHLLYTQVLDDHDPEDRELGMSANFTYLTSSPLVVFYLDYGMSQGMQAALDFCDLRGLPVAFRYIGKNPAASTQESQ